MIDHSACRAALPALLAGDLARDDAGRVADHLAGCAACGRELASWQAIAAATIAEGRRAAPLVAEDIAWSRVQRRIAPAPWRGYLVDLAAAQLRRVRRDLGIVAGSLVALVVVVAILPMPWAARVSALTFLAPLLAALGGLALFGGATSEEELTATLPVPAWAVAGLRVALVYGAILALNVALAAGAVLGQPGFTAGDALGLWLAPLSCLAALTMLAAAAGGTAVALVATGVLWALRLADRLAGTLAGPPLVAYEGFWRSGGAPLAVAAVALAAALLLTARRAGTA